MFFNKRILVKLLINLRNKFYNNTFEFLLFIFTILFLKIVQIEYRVKGFNYLLAAALFFLGIGIFKLYDGQISKRLRIGLSIGILTIMIICFTLERLEFTNIFNKYIGYYKDVQDAFYLSTETYFYQFAPFIIIAVPVIIAVTLYFNSKGLGNIVLAVTFMYLLNIWHAADLLEIKIYILIYMILCCITFCYIRFNKSLNINKKNGIKITVNHNKVLNYILVVSVIVGVVSYYLVNIFGYKSAFTFANEWLENSRTMIERSRNSRYDLSGSGYTNNSNKLGGPITLNYDRAFKVEAEKQYYLKGVVKDYYDGYKWTKTDNKYEKKAEENINYISAGLNKYLQGTDQDWNNGGVMQSPEVGKIVIHPADTLNTSTVFTPSFTFDIKLSKGNLGYDASGGFIALGRTSIKDAYTVYYYKSKTGVESFSKAYENNIQISYASGDNISPLERSYYEQNINNNQYKKYLQLPKNISPEVYELVNYIIKDCKTSSDKVKRIQEYLSENYKYSLNVSKVPENKEFVDYFLFSEKKGYCTYFATATTIMCRIAGIPARYVEGFNMGEDKEEHGWYNVSNAMAHAWTEILLNPEEDIWSVVDPVTDAVKEENKGPNYSTTLPSYITRSTGNGSGENIQVDTSSSKNNKFMVYSLLGISCVFAAVGCYIMALIVMFEIKKKRMLESKSSIPLYYYVNSRLKSIDKSFKIPNDDFEWISSTQDKELKSILEKLVEAAYEEFYGKRSTLKLDKREIYRFIELHAKKNQNRIKYFMVKIMPYNSANS